MPSKRTFYKTIISIEVLSEDPLPDQIDLNDIAYGITDGDWSGTVEKSFEKTLTGPETAVALADQGSDPEFFQLDEDGNDIDGSE